MKTPIFVDSVFIIAATNRRDNRHSQAVQLAQRFEGHPMLVTDAVLLEVGNALSRNHKQEAIRVIERFLSAEESEVVHLTPQLFEQAFALYKAYQDKTWGLVDCISFIVMREAGVTAALTTDHHFDQAGFEVLMREDVSK